MPAEPVFAQLTDEEVVARVRAGDAALYEVLMRRHNQRLFRIARSITGDADEAEDVMQEAYVRAYVRLDQFEGRSSFVTWLTRIAVHEASARRKRRARARPLDDAAPGAGKEPGEEAAMRELLSVIEAAIDALPESLRAAFALREVEGLSTADAADCLDVTEDALKVRLHRARGALKKDLLKRLGDAMPEVYAFKLVRCDRVVERVMARIRGVRPGSGPDAGSQTEE